MASDKDLSISSTYVRPNFYMVFSRLDKKPSHRKVLNLKINYKIFNISKGLLLQIEDAS